MAQSDSFVPPVPSPSPAPSELTEYKSSLDAAEAFLNSERKYAEQGLRVGFETFYNRLNVHIRLKNPILNEDEINQIFGNYSTIYNVNSKLNQDLLNLRLIGREALRDGLGTVMVNFIPFFKMYTDYIVRSRDGIIALNTLKQSNKKFREWLTINEECANNKLKFFIEEPASRLPQYLQQMADIYVAFENEDNKDSAGAIALFNAIVNIKKVTDEISIKCRDKKARTLVGKLQSQIFHNKIALIASHRFVVFHGKLKLVGKKNLISHELILCNDILVISTQSSRWSAGSLVCVFPLIGLRIIRNPNIDALFEKDAQFRFGIIPQNKNLAPSEANAIGIVVIAAENDEALKNWINIIEDTVDEEEHNLRPCNPIDLEKRLRKEKTSQEGIADTIIITDETRKKEIEDWKLNKEARMKNKRHSREQSNDKQLNVDDKRSSSTSMNVTLTSVNDNSVLSTNNTSVNVSDTASINSTIILTTNTLKSSQGSVLPPSPRRTTSNLGVTTSNTNGNGASKRGPPPKRGAPPPRGAKSASNVFPTDTINSTDSSSSIKTSEISSTTKPKNTRNLLLSGISSFNKENLRKKSDEPEETQDKIQGKSSSKDQTMGDLLQTTLANYRQFVMDEDDEQHSDNEWDD